MKQGTGKAVYPGIAIGPVYVYQKTAVPVQAESRGAEQEQAAFDAACETAKAQLAALYEKASKELGEEHAQIFDVQRMMLEDLDFLEDVEARIKSGTAAVQAVHETGEMLAGVFAGMEDSYLQARAADMRDIAARVVKALSAEETAFTMDVPGILVADDLNPSETVQLPKDKILAFVTKGGSLNSHTAILARMMNLPSLVQTDLEPDETLNGKVMIVDGKEGRYWLEPDETTLAEKTAQQEKQREEKRALEAYRGKPTVTKKGQTVKLYANIGKPEDVKAVLDGDAEGVGLMRSEFLYLGRSDFPTEEELYEAYRDVVVGLQGRPVVIRTLDIGADKQVDYFGLAHEENPALGYRGIRICLTRDDIFRPQMRAIYRAAALGKVYAMFPMIISVQEVRKIKAFCETIQAELKAEGLPFGEVELGIMIETPAAAVISRELAKEVQFFSVGTNDLTQYTLAIDRQNTNLDEFYDAHHPAVLELLRMIAENAHKEGIWAGICGELGADPTLTETFLQMGYDELSVSPGRVLELRKKICESEG